jgi:mRNA-degrading endonuclease RelE of RelBE toxin-antitoxin system
VVRVAQAIRLDTAQQRMIADSVEVARLALADWQKANEPKMEELKKQYEKLYEQRAAMKREESRLQGAWRLKVAEVLTAKQIALWVRYQLEERIRHYPTSYQFTAEQKQKTEALVAAAVEKALAVPAAKRREEMYNISQDLRTAVRALVTPAQRRQREVTSATYYINNHFERVKLTPEQQQQIKDLVAKETEAMSKKTQRVAELYKELEALRKTTSSGSSSFYRALREKARKAVLTDAQRAALERRKRQ